jgi:hypothetical protein
MNARSGRTPGDRASPPGQTRSQTSVAIYSVDGLNLGAANSLAPGQIDTAPLFFTALVEDVGTGWTGCRADVNAKARFERWLDLIDPLSLAEDPECQYLAQLKESVDRKAS